MTFEEQPWWMSDEQWEEWKREFSLLEAEHTRVVQEIYDLLGVPTQIPIKRVTKEQAHELRVMVYGA